MTTEQLVNALADLDNFDFENFTNDRYRLYKQMFRAVFDGVNETPLGQIETNGLEVSRCRRNKDRALFKRIKQVSYPDPEYVPHGRLNFQYDPIFYSSENEAIALIEMRPLKGEMMTVLKVRLTSPFLKLISIGGEVLKFGRAKFKTEQGRVLNEFIAKYCRKHVPSERPELYTPTMIYARSVLHNDFDGFCYESVPAKFNGLNFALKPAYIDTHTEFVEARAVRIVDADENGDFIVQCLSIATEASNGNFIWREIQDCKGHAINKNGLGEHYHKH